MILIASMTPRGALRLNPQLISDEIGKDFEEVHPSEQLRLGKTHSHAISEKDGDSSVAPTEPEIKHETSSDAGIVPSPVTPTSPTNPFGPTSEMSRASDLSNGTGNREQRRSLARERSASRERRPKSASAGRERQRPMLETRVHMPTGNRVDLNVGTRALPLPPPSPYSHSTHSTHSPHSATSLHSPHTPIVERTHSHF